MKHSTTLKSPVQQLNAINKKTYKIQKAAAVQEQFLFFLIRISVLVAILAAIS